MNTADLLHVLIYLPILFGLVLFFPPEKNLTVKGAAALALSLLVLAAALLLQGTAEGLYPHNPLPEFIADANRYAAVRIDGLSRVVVLFIAIFSVLILLYALVYQKAHRHLAPFLLFPVHHAGRRQRGRAVRQSVALPGILGTAGTHPV
jgi:NADH:ubiquinone oxidoreductase subunit 5 (subunit L)/multisubunit Na+/H+ antiporter MnhA subunit